MHPIIIPPGEALHSNDREVYVSVWSTSSIWPEDADLPEVADKVSGIWDIAHVSVKELLKAAGLTQAKAATHFCIPLRTLEDWSRGARKCPDYLRLMMAEALGLITR